MKSLLVLMLLSTAAFADCDIRPLRQEILKAYKSEMPIVNEKGEKGVAAMKDILVTDYLLTVKNVDFLLASFNLHVNWEKSPDQVFKTQIVASVDPATCTIENYNRGNVLGSSMTGE